MKPEQKKRRHHIVIPPFVAAYKCSEYILQRSHYSIKYHICKSRIGNDLRSLQHFIVPFFSPYCSCIIVHISFLIDLSSMTILVRSFYLHLQNLYILIHIYANRSA